MLYCCTIAPVSVPCTILYYALLGTLAKSVPTWPPHTRLLPTALPSPVCAECAHQSSHITPHVACARPHPNARSRAGYSLLRCHSTMPLLCSKTELRTVLIVLYCDDVDYWRWYRTSCIRTCVPCVSSPITPSAPRRARLFMMSRGIRSTYLSGQTINWVRSNRSKDYITSYVCITDLVEKWMTLNAIVEFVFN